MGIPLRRKKSSALPAIVEAPTVANPPTPVPEMMTWERAVMLWRQRQRSLQTAATYASAVKPFLETPGIPAPHLLTVGLLDAYASRQAFISDHHAPPGDRKAPATANLRIAALRSLLDFCRKRHWLSPDLTAEQIDDALQPVSGETRRPYEVIEATDEFAAILRGAEQDQTDGARAVTLIALLLGTGLRISEAVALDVGDIAYDKVSCFVDVRQGKGRRRRQVPMSDDVYEIVLHYIAATGRSLHAAADRATPLFLSRKQKTLSGRLSTRHARRIMVAAAARVGLNGDHADKHITPHGLRHSYALDVLLGDAERPPAPLPAVSKLLGHSSIAVTGRYLDHFVRRDLAAFAPKMRRVKAE